VFGASIPVHGVDMAGLVTVGSRLMERIPPEYHIARNKDWILNRRWFRYLLYSLVFAVFLSPYFTPPSTLGPEGIIRLDQVVIVLLVSYIFAHTYSSLNLELNLFTLSLLGLTIVIFASYFNGIVFFGHPNRLGDVYDAAIWGAYFISSALLIGAISINTTRKMIYMILLGSFMVSLLGLLQILDLWSSTSIVQTLYAPGKFETSGRIDAVETNPNVYANLLMIPALTMLAYLGRGTLSYVQRYSVGSRSVEYIGFVLIAFFFVSVNIFFTYSRAVLVSTIVGGILAISIVYLKFYGWPKVAHLSILPIGGAILLLVISQVNAGIPVGRYAELFDLATDNSFQTRIARWQQVLPLLSESLILGRGPLNNGYIPELGVNYIDNGILSWWYQYGLLGLLLSITAWLSVLRYGIQVVKRNGNFERYPLIWSFSLGVLAYTLALPLVRTFYPVLQYRRPFMLYLISIVILISTHRLTTNLLKSEISKTCNADG
jgi:hypothetical protein